MRNEKDVKEKVKSILTGIGAQYFMPVQTGYGQHGVSDFVVCYRGKYFAIETKYGANVPTRLQRVFGGRVTNAGGVFLIINEQNVGSLKRQMEYYS